MSTTSRYSPLAPLALIEAKRYLWRAGTNPDTTVDPIELLAKLVDEYERHLSQDQVRAVRRAANGPLRKLVSPSQ